MTGADDRILPSQPFASLIEVQQAHLALATQNDRAEDEFRADRETGAAGPESATAADNARKRIVTLYRSILEFEWRLVATGRALAIPEQRMLAQSLLDFWVLRRGELRRRRYDAQSATDRPSRLPRSLRSKKLADYDLDNAPILPDEANPFPALLPQAGAAGDSPAPGASNMADEAAGLDPLRTMIAQAATGIGLQISGDAISAVLKRLTLYPEPLALARWGFDWLWRNRERNQISNQLVDALGDPAAKLAETAEATYQSLDDDAQRDGARRLFLAMVGQVGDTVRTVPLPVDALASAGDPAAMERAVERFTETEVIVRLSAEGAASERLLPAHSSLLQRWQRLREWMAEQANADGDFAAVRAAAVSWEASGSDDDLPTGEALVRARPFVDRDPLVASYVAAGEALDASRRKRLRLLLLLFALLVVVSTSSTLWGLLKPASITNGQEVSNTAAPFDDGAFTDEIARNEFAPLTQPDPSPPIAPAPDGPGLKAWIWIGTGNDPQLVDLNKGEPIDPSTVKKGMRFALRTGLRLRDDAAPAGPGDIGTNRSVTGIGSTGSVVIALEDAAAHDYKGSPQYWLHVRLVPRIWVQMPEALRDAGSRLDRRGTLVADWLAGEGYDAPPPQWLPSVRDTLQEIRYYYTQDAPVAQDLADRLNRLIGDKSSPITARLIHDPALVARMRENVMELWLDAAMSRRVLAALRSPDEPPTAAPGNGGKRRDDGRPRVPPKADIRRKSAIESNRPVTSNRPTANPAGGGGSTNPL